MGFVADVVVGGVLGDVCGGALLEGGLVESELNPPSKDPEEKSLPNEPKESPDEKSPVLVIPIDEGRH